MTALDAALGYVRRGCPVFPCCWRGERRKQPLTEHGLHAATTDEAQIREWWRRWPDALIGIPTGRAIGAVVLDIDVKDDRANGFDSLDGLGVAILPDTPWCTRAAGTCISHRRMASTSAPRGARGGIGPGSLRAMAYVFATGQRVFLGSWNLDTAPLAPVPTALLPHPPERMTLARSVKPVIGLSPYAEAALDDACRRIIAAPPGQQEATLNAEAFAIGTLAGAGAIPPDFGRRALTWAAHRMPDYDPRRPWGAREIEAKISRAFDDGMRRPREARRA